MARGGSESGRWAAKRGRAVIGRLSLVASQVALILALIQAYKLVRKTFIQRGAELGYQHAEQILRLERRLGIDVELSLQRRALHHHWVIILLNRYYAYFMWAFCLCAIVAIVASPPVYRRYRRTFIISMLLALPWFAIYPLAPPRFMTDHGFIDTLAVYGPNYFSQGGIVTANRYAAMPSMHVGWTIIGGLMLAGALPRYRLGQVLGALHIAMITTAVVITGNHYLLDAVGGLLVVLVALALTQLLPADLSLLVRGSRAATADAALATRAEP